MAAPEKFDQATDAELERERAKRVREQRAEHLKFVKRFTFRTSSTFMDYLHGDVDAEEAELACHYEYARELPAAREAAQQRDEWMANGADWFSDTERAAWKKLSPAERSEKAASWAYQANQLLGKTSFPFETLSFLVCESFPEKDWKELTPAERKAIAGFERKKIPPLPMTDVWTLKALGVFDQFKAMGEKARPVVEDHDPQRGKFARPYKPVPPVLQQRGPFYHAIFDLDFSESETLLVSRFKEWLRLPENKERLAKHKRPTTGTTGRPLDRLKELAAWRLYRECGNDWEKANDFANEHRKHRRPFRDAKQQDGNPANEADLFGEEADARKAQASAWKYMVEIMPQEFAPPSPYMLAMTAEIEKSASKG